MAFQNSVVGGVTLVRPAIQSPNFVTGSAGWKIAVDGSAEFNNVTIRGGTVISGTALYYNGTPAAGNLFMSIAAAAGTDSLGNAYVKGVGLYKSQGQLTAKDTSGNTAKVSGNIGGGGVLASLPGISMQPVTNTGDPATMGALDPGGGADLGLLLTSPSATSGGVPGSDFSQIYMTGAYSGPPSITLSADAVGGTINLNTVTVDDGGSVQLLAGEQVNVGSSGSTAVFASKAANTTDDLLSARISTDTTNSRFVINHAGQILWGPGGGTAVDTSLYRDTANGLGSNAPFTTYDSNTYNTWTPAFSGGGAATYTTADGWYQRIGGMIFMHAYVVVGVAGTGATQITTNLPTTPWRGSANRRQTIPGTVSGASPDGPISVVVFAGSAGATAQRIQLSDGGDAIGTDLAAGSIWIIEGWYREA